MAKLIFLSCIHGDVLLLSTWDIVEDYGAYWKETKDTEQSKVTQKQMLPTIKSRMRMKYVICCYYEWTESFKYVTSIT